MSVSWTKPQEDAIFSRGKSLAVSAAAGSGKTSVLTQRLVGLLAEGSVRADRLVVVTFTRAAAKNLQDKLYTALSDLVAQNPEDKALSRQLLSLSRAQISTIHSFCYSLVRSYQRELDLSGNLRIGDPQIIDQMKEKAIVEAVEEFLSCEDREELSRRQEICGLFGSARSLSGLYETLFQLFEKASCLPGGISFLMEKTLSLKEELNLFEKGDLTLEKTKFGRNVICEASDLFSRMALSFQVLLESTENSQVVGEKYQPFLEERIKMANRAKELCLKGDLFAVSKLIEDAFSLPLPKIMKCPEEEKGLKEEIAEIHNGLKKEALKFSLDHLKKTGKELVEEIRPALTLSEEFLSLALLCQEHFQKAKSQKALLDYSDLENLTLKLVAEKKNGSYKKSLLGQRITDEFDAVFVDEYQDSNSIQDLIFRSITREDNLFIVGDPKQSIYRFRGAEPSIFSDYKNRLPQYPSKQGAMQSIFLSHNFRSAKPILDLVNRIFQVMMDESAPDSLYKEEDRLRFGPKEEKPAPDTALYLMEKEEEETGPPDAAKLYEEENIEAKYIASQISQLLSSYQPSEIAVICRTNRQISLVQKSLMLLCIPCTQKGAGEMGTNEEFLFVRSLLQTLSGPTADIPLMGTLLSPIFLFTSDDLYEIRRKKEGGNFYSALKFMAQSGSEKCQNALKILAELREKSKNLSLQALVFHLYRTLSISEILGKGSSVVKEFILAAAERNDALGDRNLDALVTYLDRAAEKSGGEDLEEEGVRLMTIHGSKGLEFPVVFVSFLGQAFDLRDEQGKLIFSSDLGCVFHTPALSGRARLNHFLRKGAKIGLHREMVEEEKRVLYVALTRAKEKLVITGNPRSYNTLRKSLLLLSEKPLSTQLTNLLISHAKSPLELILLSLRESPAVKNLLTNGNETKDQSFVAARVKVTDAAPLLPEKEMERERLDLHKIFENLSFSYEEKELETLPKKLSVSDFVRLSREEEGDLLPRRLLDFEKGVLVSAASQIGTATHKVMQFADLSCLKENPKAEYDRLLEKGFLTAEEMALVQKDKIASFFRSSLYEKMAEGKDLVREKRFSVLLDAKPLLGKEGEVLVQGVVDAFFENPDGSLSLVDFKTDRVKTEEQLLSRHKEQLSLYATALSKLTGKSVSKIYLYSFALEKEILVN